MNDAVQVVARVRPISGDGVWDIKETSLSIGPTQYAFHRVHGPSTSNEKLYRDVAAYLEHTLDGFNSTLCAYGQSGSGKTHTILGTDKDPGLVQRAAHDLFKRIKSRKSRNFEVKASLFQVYNNQVQDLLSTNGQSQNLKLLQDHDQNLHIQGLKWEPVNNGSSVEQLLIQGDAGRRCSTTNLNEASSRSHVILMMEVRSESVGNRSPRGASSTGNGNALVSRLVFVDLAGTENIETAGLQGEQLEETKAISLSLLALGSVMEMLSKGDPGAHIPYRRSILTRVLQLALGGNCKTLIICAINPAAEHIKDSQRTLQFALVAKTVQNKPMINQVAMCKTDMRPPRPHGQLQTPRTSLKSGFRREAAVTVTKARRLLSFDQDRSTEEEPPAAVPHNHMALNEQHSALQQELADVKATQGLALAALQQEAHAAVQEANSLRMQLQQAVSRTKEVDAYNAQLQGHVEALQAELQLANQAAGEAAAASQQHLTSQGRLVQEQQQNEDLSNRLQALQAELQLANQTASAAAAAAASQQEYQALQSRVVQEQEQKSGLRNQLQELQTQHEAQLAEQRELKQMTAELLNEVESLRGTLASEQGMKAQLQAQQQDMHQQHAVLSEQLGRLQQQLHQTQQQLERSDNALQDALESEAGYQITLKNEQLQVQQLQQQVVSLSSQLQSSQAASEAQAQALLAAHQEEHLACSAAQQQLEEEKARVARLTEQLQAARSSMAQQEQEHTSKQAELQGQLQFARDSADVLQAQLHCVKEAAAAQDRKWQAKVELLKEQLQVQQACPAPGAQLQAAELQALHNKLALHEAELAGARDTAATAQRQCEQLRHQHAQEMETLRAELIRLSTQHRQQRPKPRQQRPLGVKQPRPRRLQLTRGRQQAIAMAAKPACSTCQAELAALSDAVARAMLEAAEAKRQNVELQQKHAQEMEMCKLRHAVALAKFKAQAAEAKAEAAETSKHEAVEAHAASQRLHASHARQIEQMAAKPASSTIQLPAGLMTAIKTTHSKLDDLAASGLGQLQRSFPEEAPSSATLLHKYGVARSSPEPPAAGVDAQHLPSRAAFCQPSGPPPISTPPVPSQGSIGLQSSSGHPSPQSPAAAASLPPASTSAQPGNQRSPSAGGTEQLPLHRCVSPLAMSGSQQETAPMDVDCTDLQDAPQQGSHLNTTRVADGDQSQGSQRHTSPEPPAHGQLAHVKARPVNVPVNHEPQPVKQRQAAQQQDSHQPGQIQDSLAPDVIEIPDTPPPASQGSSHPSRPGIPAPPKSKAQGASKKPKTSQGDARRQRDQGRLSTGSSAASTSIPRGAGSSQQGGPGVDLASLMAAQGKLLVVRTDFELPEAVVLAEEEGEAGSSSAGHMVLSVLQPSSYNDPFTGEPYCIRMAVPVLGNTAVSTLRLDNATSKTNLRPSYSDISSRAVNLVADARPSRGSRVEVHFYLHTGEVYKGTGNRSGIKVLDRTVPTAPQLKYLSAVGIAVPEHDVGLGLPVDMDISKVYKDEECQPLAYSLHWLSVQDAVSRSPLFQAVQQLLQQIPAPGPAGQSQQSQKLAAAGKDKRRSSTLPPRASSQPDVMPSMQPSRAGTHAGFASQQPETLSEVMDLTQQDTFTGGSSRSHAVQVTGSCASDAGLQSQQSTQRTSAECWPPAGVAPAAGERPSSSSQQEARSGQASQPAAPAPKRSQQQPMLGMAGLRSRLESARRTSGEGADGVSSQGASQSGQ